MALYLADSSIWVARRLPDGDDLRQRFLDRFRRGELATCALVALEVLSGAPDEAAYGRDWTSVWQALFWLPVGERATQRALEVQRELLQKDPEPERPATVTLLIAACAEEAGQDVILWHADSDLAAICELTGQPQEPEPVPARA